MKKFLVLLIATVFSVTAFAEELTFSGTLNKRELKNGKIRYSVATEDKGKIGLNFRKSDVTVEDADALVEKNVIAVAEIKTKEKKGKMKYIVRKLISLKASE